MSIKKIAKEELELMSNKDIAYMILEERTKSISTAELFKEIINLLELPESTFEEKIGDFYTILATDKRFVLLDDGSWDLRNRHTSDKIVKVINDEEDDEELLNVDEEDDEEILEDNYDSVDDDDYVDPEEDIKDFVIVDENVIEAE